MPYIGRGLEKGNYLKLDDISSQFDGSKTTFDLTVGGSAHVPGSSYSLLVSLSGIIQEGEAAYTLDQNQITFAAAPQAVDDCYIISLGTPIGIGVPGDGTVSGPQFAKPFNYENFFYLDHTTQRVGIGTTVPTQSLDVYDGNIAIRDPATASQFLGFYHNRNVLKASIDKTGNNLTFENVDSGIIDYKIGGSSRVSIGSTGKIFFGTDDNTYFYRPGADTLAFVTAGTERLRIRSDGHIGIGTDVVNKLVSIKAVHPFLRLEASDTSDKRLDFQVSSAGIATISAEQSSQQLSFKTTSGEALRIKADGTINITTQNGSLEWTASSGSNPFIRSIGAGQTALEFNTGGNEALRIAHGDLLLGGHGSRIFDDADGENIVVDIYGGTTAGKRGILALGGRTGSDDGDIGTIQFLNENNNLATAANHVQSKLVASIDVKSETTNGNASANSGSHLIFSTKAQNAAIAERLHITSGGQVNIAGDYSQTSYVLSVTNSSNTNLFRIKTANEGDYDLRFNIQNSEAMIWHYGTDDLVFGNRYDRKLSLITNAQKRLTVSGNYIGINETSPGTYLHVKGTGEMLRLETTASGGGQCYIDFDDETATRASIGMRGSSSDTLTIAALNAGLRFDTSGQTQAMNIAADGKVGINQPTPTTYQLEVVGSFAATTKSFVIDHPTKEKHKLRYACLEGPENSVYVRGKTSDSVIELPEYWVGLVHEDSITVNVTPIGNHKVWVESINNNSITIGSDGSEYFYTVFAERKDVDKLEVEVAD